MTQVERKTQDEMLLRLGHDMLNGALTVPEAHRLMAEYIHKAKDAGSVFEELMLMFLVRMLHEQDWYVTPQWQSGEYRFDFMLRHVNEDRIIIECDGLEWHNNKEQMYKDRERDRYCAGNGWPVLRYMWDDLHKSGWDKELKKLLGPTREEYEAMQAACTNPPQTLDIKEEEGAQEALDALLAEWDDDDDKPTAKDIS